MPPQKPSEDASGLKLGSSTLPSPEEKAQADDLRAEHPWCLTFRQFLALVKSYFNIHLRRIDAEEAEGLEEEIWYLWSPEEERFVVLPKLDLDDQLDEHTTAQLCRGIRKPQELFGLKPLEPLTDGEEFDLGS